MKVSVLCDQCKRPFMCEEEKVDDNEVKCSDCKKNNNEWDIDNDNV